MIAKANVPFPIGYANLNQLTGLFLRAQILNITSGSPVAVGTVNLVEDVVNSGCYSANFAGGADGDLYSVVILAYTDGTYAVVDTEMPPVKSEVQFVDFAASSAEANKQDLLMVLDTDVGAGLPKRYVQGEKVEFIAQLAVRDRFGLVRPYDLTGNSEITMIWKAATSVLKKNRVAATVGVVVIGALTEGKIKGTLLSADTDAQPKISNGLIEVDVKFGSEFDKFQVKNAFIVDEKADA